MTSPNSSYSTLSTQRFAAVLEHRGLRELPYRLFTELKKLSGYVALAGLVASSSLRAFAYEAHSTTKPIPQLLEKYCFDCHGDGMNKGKVALDELMKAGTGVEQQREWLKTWKILRHEFMPPAGEELPSAPERKALADWIAREKLGVDFSKPDPGRVTLRRLNRMEYDYSVQDLFGANLSAHQDYSSDNAAATLQLRDRLPPDDTAFGFDNIGDFLSVSPALLEKYFEIAEFVVERVVVFDGPRSPERELAPNPSKVTSSEKKQTEQTATFEIQKPGAYRIDFQFTTGGWQEYGGAYDFRAKVNDEESVRDAIDVGGYVTHKHSIPIDLTVGKHTLALVMEPTKPDSKGELKPLELRPRMKLVGPLGDEFREYPEPHQKIFFKGDAPPDPSARKAYAREILERIASRAFRRPVDPATLDGLVELSQQHATFERGIGQALTAILTSPKFLFRAETQPQPNDPKVVHPLDEYALASRLSYLLWLSLPDEELLRLARNGELRSNLSAQIKRMLADKKSERFFEDFPGQWLRTRNVLMTSIITRYDDVLDPVRGSMKKETEMLFEHIARNDLDLAELITADYTFVDKKLAAFYGLKEVPEPGFHRVNLPPESKRGGILTHGSFLVATSNPNRTSPVKRGLFVLENLLAVEPPPPPPDIPALEDVNIGDTSKKTGREQLALHRENKSCAACHNHFDPIGVALENYDLIGRWRDKENDKPIDPAERTISGQTLSGFDDVRKLLAADKEKFYHGTTEKLLTYALGRGLEPSDMVTVDAITQRLAANNGTFSTLLMAVVESTPFQMRRGDDGAIRSSPRNYIPPTPPPEKRKPQRRFRPPAVTNEVVSVESPANNLEAKGK